jgi:hypothetical protein
MLVRHRASVLVVAILGLAVLFSCAKKEKKAEAAPAGTAAKDSTLSYVSEEVSLGVFFDKEGTKRTTTLGGRDKQVTIYIFVNYPETMQIAAVEYRLALPKGVTVETDKFYAERTALLGTFEHGISEAFPCVAGPKLLLHQLVLNVPGGLKDAEIALLTDEQNQFMGVAMCDDAKTTITGVSYKAVINPSR